MARFPGTERPVNDAGWLPATAVRARRMRANASLGVFDRRGFVTQVRQDHVRVYFGDDVGFFWLPSQAVVAEPEIGRADVETLRTIHELFEGQRLEFEDDQIVIFSEGFDASAVDQVRQRLGTRLTALRFEAAGVHEMAVWMTVTRLD